MSKPIATMTVEFSRPFKGSELMTLVKDTIEAADEGSSQFYSEQRFDDGDVFTIGRVSGYPTDHLLVAPTRESSDVRPDEEYTSVVVASTKWPVSIYLVGTVNPEEVITREVRDFADALKQAVVGTSAPESEAWPQEVHVCAMCTKIADRKDDGFINISYSCWTHGDNVPTRVVKVAPVDQ